MTDEPYTKREHDSHHQELKTLIEIGFKGVHRRQDISNGRTAKIEERADDLEKADIKIGADLTNLIKDESKHIQEAKVKGTKWEKRAWEIFKIVLPFIGFLLFYYLATQ